jgi:hypothetical protein
MRSLKAVLVSVGFVSTVLAIAPQAKAASFSGFSFGTQVSGSNAQQDIMLQSVNIGSLNVNNFETVQTANIITNAITVPRPPQGAQGPASSDHGDFVATCPAVDAGMTSADVVASLGNLNLNCIIDTEDNIGESVIDVFFNPNKLINTFFLFERGMNSDIQIEAIGADGQVISGSDFLIGRNDWANANYSINTTESNAQRVGSYGVKANQRLLGLRLTSQIGFNGPDFKVVATQVPEPTTMLGLGAVSGAAFLLRRRKQQQVQG